MYKIKYVIPVPTRSIFSQNTQKHARVHAHTNTVMHIQQYTHAHIHTDSASFLQKLSCSKSTVSSTCQADGSTHQYCSWLPNPVRPYLWLTAPYY